MKRITHSVDPEKMRDLLDRVPRACVAFANAGVVELLPAEFRFEEGRYWIGISSGGSGPAPRPGEPAKLLIDEGTYYFDMRGIWIRPCAASRGRLPKAPPAPAPSRISSARTG